MERVKQIIKKYIDYTAISITEIAEKKRVYVKFIYDTEICKLEIEYKENVMYVESDFEKDDNYNLMLIELNDYLQERYNIQAKVIY